MGSKLEQPHDRGSFLKTMGTLFAGFVAERLEATLESIGPKILRPPGALNELAFLTECTRCDKCIEACPQGSLVRAPTSSGLAMGTPQLVPRQMPCFLCEYLPCIEACADKALVWPRIEQENGTVLEGPRAVRIGVAYVKPSTCLAHETPSRPAEECRSCIDRCPYPGIAIRLRYHDDGRAPHPEVIEEACTGCGLCEFGCPAPLPGIIVRDRL